MLLRGYLYFFLASAAIAKPFPQGQTQYPQSEVDSAPEEWAEPGQDVGAGYGPGAPVSTFTPVDEPECDCDKQSTRGGGNLQTASTGYGAGASSWTAPGEASTDIGSESPPWEDSETSSIPPNSELGSLDTTLNTITDFGSQNEVANVEGLPDDFSLFPEPLEETPSNELGSSGPSDALPEDFSLFPKPETNENLETSQNLGTNQNLNTSRRSGARSPLAPPIEEPVNAETGAEAFPLETQGLDSVDSVPPELASATDDGSYPEDAQGAEYLDPLDSTDSTLDESASEEIAPEVSEEPPAAGSIEATPQSSSETASEDTGRRPATREPRGRRKMQPLAPPVVRRSLPEEAISTSKLSKRSLPLQKRSNIQKRAINTLPRTGYNEIVTGARGVRAFWGPLWISIQLFVEGVDKLNDADRGKNRINHNFNQGALNLDDFLVPAEQAVLPLWNILQVWQDQALRAVFEARGQAPQRPQDYLFDTRYYEDTVDIDSTNVDDMLEIFENLQFILYSILYGRGLDEHPELKNLYRYAAADKGILTALRSLQRSSENIYKALKNVKDIFSSGNWPAQDRRNGRDAPVEDIPETMLKAQVRSKSPTANRPPPLVQWGEPRPQPQLGYVSENTGIKGPDVALRLSQIKGLRDSQIRQPARPDQDPDLAQQMAAGQPNPNSQVAEPASGVQNPSVQNTALEEYCASRDDLGNPINPYSSSLSAEQLDASTRRYRYTPFKPFDCARIRRQDLRLDDFSLEEQPPLEQQPPLEGVNAVAQEAASEIVNAVETGANQVEQVEDSQPEGLQGQELQGEQSQGPMSQGEGFQGQQPPEGDFQGEGSQYVGSQGEDSQEEGSEEFEENWQSFEDTPEVVLDPGIPSTEGEYQRVLFRLSDDASEDRGPAETWYQAIYIPLQRPSNGLTAGPNLQINLVPAEPNADGSYGAGEAILTGLDGSDPYSEAGGSFQPAQMIDEEAQFGPGQMMESGVKAGYGLGTIDQETQINQPTVNQETQVEGPQVVYEFPSVEEAANPTERIVPYIGTEETRRGIVLPDLSRRPLVSVPGPPGFQPKTSGYQKPTPYDDEQELLDEVPPANLLLASRFGQPVGLNVEPYYPVQPEDVERPLAPVINAQNPGWGTGSQDQSQADPLGFSGVSSIARSGVSGMGGSQVSSVGPADREAWVTRGINSLAPNPLNQDLSSEAPSPELNVSELDREAREAQEAYAQLPWWRRGINKIGNAAKAVWNEIRTERGGSDSGELSPRASAQSSESQQGRRWFHRRQGGTDFSSGQGSASNGFDDRNNPMFASRTGN